MTKLIRKVEDSREGEVADLGARIQGVEAAVLAERERVTPMAFEEGRLAGVQQIAREG